MERKVFGNGILSSARKTHNYMKLFMYLILFAPTKCHDLA